MTSSPSRVYIQSRSSWLVHVFVSLLFVGRLLAEPVVLHLKSGDRISGNLTFQSEEKLVIDTPWAKSLTIPLDQVERRENLKPAAPPTPSTTQATVAAESSAKAADSTPVAKLPEKAKSPREWKFDAKLGTDMIRGERDRDIYYGQFALNYAHPYESNPKKFFRNQLDYRVDYGTTDGQKSANRMYASDKTDFDIGKSTYAYNNVGGGYDEVRKINSEIEAGPGIGLHVLRHANFVANVESGLTYQNQNREDDMDVESLYARLGQDCTWKVNSKVTFTQRSSLLASLEDSDEFQFRLEANLSVGIVKNLSLNLTALELYDTRPVQGVTENEFQLRSSLGITF